MEVFRFCNKGVRQRLWAEGLTSGVPRPVGSSSEWGVCQMGGPPDQGGEGSQTGVPKALQKIFAMLALDLLRVIIIRPDHHMSFHSISNLLSEAALWTKASL